MSLLKRLYGLISPAPEEKREVVSADEYFAGTAAWHRVSSSNVHSFAYYGDTDGKGVLAVRFKDKKTGAVKSEYRYSMVPYELYAGFLDAGSKGKFVWSDIRDKYPFHGPI